MAKATIKHHQHFDCMGDMARWIEDTPKAPNGGDSSEQGGRDAWYGNASFQEAVEMALTGWDGPRDQVNESARQVTADALRATTEYRPMPHHGFIGCDLDIDRFTMGEPMCLVDFIPSPTEGRQRVIGLNISVSASAGVEPETLVKRGSAIVALIDILSTTGRAVEVFVEQAVESSGNNTCVVTVQVKKADQHLDLDQLLFAIAHPAMLRRMVFAVEERLPEHIVSEFGFNGGGYGRPAKLTQTEAFQATVAIDTVSWGGNNREVTDPVGWIHDVLDDIAKQELVHED